MGNSSTAQAQANQAYNQQAAEQYLRQSARQAIAGLQGLPASPASSWAGIQGPSGQYIARPYDPRRPVQVTPLRTALNGAGPRLSTPRSQGTV